MSRSKAQPVQNEKKKVAVKTGIIAGVIVLFLLAALSLGAYALFNHYFSMLNQDSENENAAMASSIPDDDDTDPSLGSSSPEEIKAQENLILKNWEANKDKVGFDGEVYNILLIGSDTRDSKEAGRSDTMIVLSVNKRTQQVTLTSIMRDTYVYIPRVGFNRINAAIVFGGPSLLFDTIEQNFNIHIDNYVKADFASFIDIVDLMGGVDIAVSAAEADLINASAGAEDKALTVELAAEGDKSLQHLTGAQALAYSRIRYLGDADFERTERQRTVLLQLIEKGKALSISELNDLAKELFPLVSTNLTRGQTLSLLWNYFTAYRTYEVQTFRIPQDDTYEFLMKDGMSVLGIDFEKNIEDFSLKVYGNPSAAEK